MDEPRNLRAVFLLDRDDKAPLAHSHDAFLQIGRLLLAAQDAVQLFADLRVFGLDAAADVAQFARGVVRDLLLA